MEDQDYESRLMQSILRNKETALLLESCPATIRTGGVLDIIMASKRQQVLKIHPYTITPPKTENDRWQTSYRDVNNKRKCLKARTQEELLNKLVELYFDSTYIDNLTFHDLYKEWLAYKKTLVNSQNTIKRHEQQYKKYFEDSLLHNYKVRQLDELTLESECNRIIRAYNMSYKEWTNARTILNGMFTFAVRKHILYESPMANVLITV